MGKQFDISGPDPRTAHRAIWIAAVTLAAATVCGVLAFAVSGGSGRRTPPASAAATRVHVTLGSGPVAAGTEPLRRSRVGSNSRSAPGPATQSAPSVPGIVLVGFEAGTSARLERRLVRALGARDLRVIGAGTHVLRLAGTSVSTAITALRREHEVRYAEPDYIAQASAVTPSVPNDTSFASQWGSQNTGQSVPSQGADERLGSWAAGSPGADDRASWAWNTTTGSQSIVIGEVDTGVDYNHADLAQNIWSNSGLIGGCPPGTHGYNVVAGTCDPMDDDNAFGGHGTHVAGIMGALGNNSAGVAGMNWSTTILPVKWLDSNANGTTTNLISALAWLVSAKQAGVNVRVVNDSATFQGTAPSQALSDEIGGSGPNSLNSNNILFVTAAGNTSQNNDNVARYPCDYGLPNEICVTASDHNDKIPSWANYGPGNVDLAAPGVSVYSTLRNSGFGWLSGGSMASAQVAGAAALVLADKPSLTTSEVKSAILGNVDPIPGMTSFVGTGGRLNVCKAIPGCQQPAIATTLQAVPGPAIGTSEVLNGSVSPQRTSTSYVFRYSQDASMQSGVLQAPSTSQNLGSGTNGQAVSQTITGLQPNTTYYFQVVATNATGTTSGSVLSFSTSLGPQVSTQATSSVTGSSAVLNGLVNPENSATTYAFKYSTDPNMTNAASTLSQSAGSGGTDTTVSQLVTGLQPNATYYFEVVATNAANLTTTSSVGSFVTSTPPVAITQTAQSIATTSAVLSGSINPQNSATTYVFRYSTDSSMQNGVQQVPADIPQTVGSDDVYHAVSQPVSGLASGATYYFQVVATNSATDPTLRTAIGSVVPFTTLAPPTAVTLPASSVGSSSAVLNGSVNPANSPTSYTFQYSQNPDMSGATQASGPSSAGSDGADHPASQTVSGLAPNTTYYFQIVAASAGGTRSGSVLSFRSLPQAKVPPPPGGESKPPKPSYSTRVPSGQTLNSLLSRGLTVRVRCAKSCSLTAELLLPVTYKLSRHRIRTTLKLLGNVSKTLTGDRTLQLVIALSHSGRSAVMHLSRVVLTLQLSAIAQGARAHATSATTTTKLRIVLVRSGGGKSPQHARP